MMIRGHFTPLKITMLTIWGALYAAYHLLQTYLPYPAVPEGLVFEEMQQNYDHAYM